MGITKRIVDAMGGTIELITEQGEGAEFVVNFQLELQEHARDGSGARSCDPGPRREHVDFAGKRVLLVEDNGINREIAAMMLESLGFEVDEVLDGKQAVESLVFAGPGWYDIVVTDIQMPVMNGYDEARAIRALPDLALSRTPIVAMSADAFQEDVKASREAGMNAHVAKPVDIATLAAALDSALSASR